MTGHHAGHKLRNTPAADHRLDQFAAAVAEARTTQPALAALGQIETQFIDTAMDIGAHLDRATVGAAWLILGQLFGTNLASTPPDQQAGQLVALLNVAKLAGQRLYVGDRLPVEMRCPFTYATGAPCTKLIKGSDEKQFDTYMRAHIWQQHPGETWPPKEPEGREPRAYQYQVGGPIPPDDGGPYPPSALGDNPTFDQLKRFANVRVLALTYLGVDRKNGDPVTGRKGELTTQDAWAQAERDYDRLLAERAQSRSASDDETQD